MLGLCTTILFYGVLLISSSDAQGTYTWYSLPLGIFYKCIYDLVTIILFDLHCVYRMLQK